MSYKKQFLRSSYNLRFSLLVILLLGFLFRFTNLSSKVFWVDEVATAVRVSGYTIPEVVDSLSAQDIVNRPALMSFQTINNDRTFSDSLNAFRQSPEHAPLYFILTRFWMQWQDHSIAMMRSLSAIFSLCALPCMYWLCYELFERSPFRKRTSWFALGIMSLSPFYVAYAQEARPYSLWTVSILLAGASFLRAKRLNKFSDWCLYSVCLVFSFYTSLLSIYLAIFQGLYLLIQVNQKNLEILRNYLCSSIFSVAAFSPWILVIINHFDLLQDNTSWMRGNFNLADIIAVYIGTDLLILGDLPLSTDTNPIQIAIALLVIVIVSLAGIKCYPRWQNKTLKLTCLGLAACLL
ncbi:MAG: glycosyltransferase family 39 protein, partial [Cyanobacteria bacterium J06600_6]